MARVTWLALFALMGCTPTDGPSTDELNTDQRIDGGDPSADPSSSDPQMCVSPDGNWVFVVWIDDRDGNEDVWMNRSNDGGHTWLTSPIRVKQGGGDASFPSIDCTDSRLYVVWEDTRDGELEYKNVYFQVSATQGDVWLEEDLNLDLDPEGLTISQGPQVLAVEGKVFVAWSDNINGAPDIYMAASRNQGNSFEEPIRIDSDEEGSAFSGLPVLANAGGNNVYITWLDLRDGGNDIYFASSTNGGQDWSSDKRIDLGDAAGASDAFAPTIGASGDHVYVAWHDTRNGAGRDILMNYSSNAGGSWLGEAVRVDSDSEGFFDSLFPNVYVEGDEAHIVWQDARNVGFDIYYRKATAGDFDAEVPEERLDTDQAGFGQSLYPTIAVEDDTMAVGWEDYRFDPGEGYDEVRYNAFIEGEWENDDMRVDSVEEGTSFAVDVDVAVLNGEVLSVWTDGRFGTADIFFSNVVIGEEADLAVVEKEADAE